MASHIKPARKKSDDTVDTLIANNLNCDKITCNTVSVNDQNNSKTDDNNTVNSDYEINGNKSSDQPTKNSIVTNHNNNIENIQSANSRTSGINSIESYEDIELSNVLNKIPIVENIPALIKSKSDYSNVMSGSEDQFCRSVVSDKGKLSGPTNFSSNNNNNINLLNNNIKNSDSMPKGNEPVKIIYPNTIVSSQQSNMNNRVTYSNQQLPNGTLSISSLNTSQQQTIQQPISTIMQVASTSGGAIQVQAGQTTTPKATTVSLPQNQQQTLVIKNQQTQNIVGGPTMLPGVQIVNMRPNAPAVSAVPVSQGQKNVTSVSPRVVIGNPHMVATRPPNSPITLSTLQVQGLQSGQPGSAIILKTETGYQLLRVGPAPGTPVAGPNQLATTGNQTLRLQTVPAVSRFTGPPLALRKTIVTQQQQQNNATSSGNSLVVSTVSSVPNQVISTQNSGPTIVPVASIPALTQTHNVAPITVANAAAGNQGNTNNTKEKCRKFLANLIELSSREPKPVERNVRTLIQELVEAKVEPEEFCDRLERLLNASPQPCLIGFLKRSLPHLRLSLYTKELVIDGIKPPPHNVAFAGVTTIGNQLGNVVQTRPVVNQQAPGVKQTQVRMITQPGGPISRPFGQTTITRHPAGVRIQGPIVAPGSQFAQVRPSANNTGQVNASNPPALQPVGTPHRLATPTPRQNSAQNKASTPGGRQQNAKNNTQSLSTKVAHTPAKSVFLTPNSVGVNMKEGNVALQSSIVTSTVENANKAKAMGMLHSSIKDKSGKDKGKDKAFFSSQSAAMSMASSLYGDDDFNDVAAMGGVNLLEESQKILGSTELIGTQIRSCKDEIFLHVPALQSKIKSIVAKHGLEEPNSEVAVLISHACQERLKNVLEKLAIIAEHRMDIIKIDPRYEATKDVRGQIKFLEELDKAEQKRHEEQEREMLLRAAKSRTKTEDPEQVKLKAKAKEMQRAEMEELRQRDANLTALQAIGPRKKPKLEGDTVLPAGASGSTFNPGNIPSTLRPRIKRVNMRDILFYFEQERDTCRDPLLYKAYLK